MEFLSQNGFNIITLDEFINHKDKNKKMPPKSIIITFDDGYADNYINALTVLEKYNFKATFFVVTDYIDSARIFQWLRFNNKPFSQYHGNKACWLPLSRQHILDMSAHGACFGSHTMTHCALDMVEESKAIEELRGSREYLEGILSKPVSYFSYPFSRANKNVKELVRTAGYRAAVIGIGANTLSSDFLELRRIEILRQDSISKFKRKVEGAYDWYPYLLSILIFVRRILYKS
jgi:peptidoglycan/xylan/chitin deacetylase (PgdA/CDA1 family)